MTDKIFTSLKHNFFILFILVLLCSSCSQSALYENYISVVNGTWEKGEEYFFTFDVEDVSIPYDVTIEIRNNNLYPFQNLWLFSSETSPKGSVSRDTLEFVLADDFGKWYGKGISVFQLRFPIHEHYFFPDTGQYVIGFRQGMRTDTLLGIQQLGLRIEQSK